MHRVIIDESRRPTGPYFWACSCGDEGGPHDSYNEAWDAIVEHERLARGIAR